MKWIQEKSKNFDDWFLMHFDLFKSTMRKSNKWIKKVTIHFLKPMVLSYLKLHFTTTRSSTFSGFNLALLGLTTLPATEKTRSDLDEAAGTGKTTLSLARRGNCVSWCFPHPSWSTEDSSSDNSWKDFVLQFVGGLELLLLLLHHVRELLLVMCLQVVSQGFGGSLANLDDQGWTWEKEYLLTSDDLWASPLAGLYLHRRHFAMAIIFSWHICWNTPIQKNGAIQIVSQVSPNFGCLFLQNNAVLLDGGHGYRLQRWICSAYISILSQHYLNNKTFIC